MSNNSKSPDSPKAARSPIHFLLVAGGVALLVLHGIRWTHEGRPEWSGILMSFGFIVFGLANLLDPSGDRLNEKILGTGAILIFDALVIKIITLAMAD